MLDIYLFFPWLQQVELPVLTIVLKAYSTLIADKSILQLLLSLSTLCYPLQVYSYTTSMYTMTHDHSNKNNEGRCLCSCA